MISEICKNAKDSGNFSAFEMCQRSEHLLTCYTVDALQPKVEEKFQLKFDF